MLKVRIISFSWASASGLLPLVAIQRCRLLPVTGSFPHLLRLKNDHAGLPLFLSFCLSLFFTDFFRSYSLFYLFPRADCHSFQDSYF